MVTVEIIQRFEARFPKPVCAGCPDGKFEDAIEKWSIALAEQLAHETGSRWGVLMNTVTGAGLVEQVGDVGRVHPWFIVDHPVEGKTIEYSEQLVSERRGVAVMPGVSWVVPTDHLRDQDRDRVAEILERLAKLESAQADNDRKAHLRSLAATGMLQRLIVLVTHYGTAPVLLEFSLFGKTFTFTLRNPQAEEGLRQ